MDDKLKAILIYDKEVSLRYELFIDGKVWTLLLLMDKTVNLTFFYIDDDRQNYPRCRLRLLVKKFGSFSTKG